MKIFDKKKLYSKYMLDCNKLRKNIMKLVLKRFYYLTLWRVMIQMTLIIL